MTALYDEALAPVGVNLAQFSLMRSISWQQPVSLTDLARVVDLDRSTVGRNVKVLAKMGLTAPGVQDDGREATVVLTKKGRTVLNEGAPLWDAAQERIESALGGDASKALHDLLAAI
jgi:DNA-binding MarR family transcriptional regulator